MLACLLALGATCLTTARLEDAELALLCFLDLHAALQPPFETPSLGGRSTLQRDAQYAKRSAARRTLAQVYIDAGRGLEAEAVLRLVLAEEQRECAADAIANPLALFARALLVQGKAEVCDIPDSRSSRVSTCFGSTWSMWAQGDV